MLGAVWLDALTLQSENRCGEDEPKVRILEGDEKSFKKITTLSEIEEMQHYFLPYIIFTERGDCERVRCDRRRHHFDRRQKIGNLGMYRFSWAARRKGVPLTTERFPIQQRTARDGEGKG